jgi:toxin ParE1/3/4
VPPRRFEVELTRGAEDDLEQIYRYLAENRSPDDAERLLDAFLEKIQTLERYPLRGGVPKELESIGIREYRQVLMRPFRLIYRIANDTVFIMIIADGRRDMQVLLERRLLGAVHEGHGARSRNRQRAGPHAHADDGAGLMSASDPFLPLAAHAHCGPKSFCYVHVSFEGRPHALPFAQAAARLA